MTLSLLKMDTAETFLIPNGLAILATESNKKVLEEKIKAISK